MTTAASFLSSAALEDPYSSSSPPSHGKKIRYIPLAYNPHNSHSSATHLVLTLFPDWKAEDLGFVRFTDGITNTLLKCVNTTKDQDEDAVLLRAYGRETGILIDREREWNSHALLSSYGLAPPLLARFNNGLIYRYVAGRVSSVRDLSTPVIYRAVANRLGEWHKVLPTEQQTQGPTSDISNLASENSLWGVLQKWITALPEFSPEAIKRKNELQSELYLLVRSKEAGGFGLRGQDGGVGLVFGHCDLLSGNVIILPEGKKEGEDEKMEEIGFAVSGSNEKRVHFIDYEYATPCERAFDISNHFAEWGGFDCDYSLIPTRFTRRDFIKTYLQSYHAHKPSAGSTSEAATDEEVEKLMAEVDLFRGVPGFYWGIWALIQAEISQIDFDYAAYAELRLGEYYAWKAEFLAMREVGTELCLREKMWAQAE